MYINLHSISLINDQKDIGYNSSVFSLLYLLFKITCALVQHHQSVFIKGLPFNGLNG